MSYSNMPFKNNQAAKADRMGMSAGPGDPPQKKGTATTVTKLDMLTADYEAGDASTKKKLQPAIMREHGGAEYLQKKTGGIGQTSTGKSVTISAGAKMRGESEAEYTKKLQRQASAQMRQGRNK